MVDAGENVGLPFSGRAPDLGAYETGMVTGIRGTVEVPVEFGIDQNYPNPFNPSTTIRYRLSDRGLVTLRVYDTLGHEIRTLVDAVQSPGEYRVFFEADSEPSGIYFARLQAGRFSRTIKVTLIK
jgi:hypothetical protein